MQHLVKTYEEGNIEVDVYSPEDYGTNDESLPLAVADFVSCALTEDKKYTIMYVLKVDDGCHKYLQRLGSIEKNGKTEYAVMIHDVWGTFTEEAREAAIEQFGDELDLAYNTVVSPFIQVGFVDISNAMNYNHTHVLAYSGNPKQFLVPLAKYVIATTFVAMPTAAEYEEIVNVDKWSDKSSSDIRVSRMNSKDIGATFEVCADIVGYSLYKKMGTPAYDKLMASCLAMVKGYLEVQAADMKVF